MSATSDLSSQDPMPGGGPGGGSGAAAENAAGAGRVPGAGTDPGVGSVPGGVPGDRAGTARRPSGRLGVGIISAGRVGAVLGSALRAAGHQVVGVHAVSEASRERAEILLAGVPVLEIDEIVERAELVLLAVPDDALSPLVQGLADLGRWQPGQLVVHTSGRYGTGVLEPARRCGAIPLAIHPAMTFSGWSVDLVRLTGCPMAVTAPGPVLPIAQALAVELGGEPFVLDEQARPAYHAALAHGANHLVTLVGQAVRLLGAAGVEDGAATLGPLLTAALDRALHEGPDAALTGPVVRGDAGTLSAHLAAISAARDAQDRPLTDVWETYRTLAAATIARQESTGRLTPSQADALRAAVGQDEGGTADGAPRG
ncbi:MAG: DUF2520 domain-containing protein [Actinomyces sp.]|uniref:Rossmann-like and DUF2520 domain-containing protein n=1 Tax=Actinomyces sp. TaxID=29317 RepID=UPI0026DA7258|nr:DUF2520 domain-containing protein [Actinomyces sp.]MDO4244273.1 DUF2520 domain-containing protein [Actinomyces sp.]